MKCERTVITNPFDCIGRISRGGRVDDFAWMLSIEDPAEWLAVIGGAVAAIGGATAMQATKYHQNESDRIIEQLAKLDCKVAESMTQQ